MKDIVHGMEKLIGGKVILLCANYFYNGKLVEVGESYVLLDDATIVYDTGQWSAKSYELAEALPSKQWSVSRQFIESWGPGK